MDFKEAVKAKFEDGYNDVRCFHKRIKLEGNKSKIQLYDLATSEFLDLMIGCVEATDWEIVEEKKTFEEELREAYDNCCFGDILDVIQSRNKEFIDWLLSNYMVINYKKIDDKAKEIYGERLI